MKRSRLFDFLRTYGAAHCWICYECKKEYKEFVYIDWNSNRMIIHKDYADIISFVIMETEFLSFGIII